VEQDESVDSPEFLLLGNPWRLEICPGGDATAAEGCPLTSILQVSIYIDFSFSVNDGNGKQVAYKQSDGPINFPPTGCETISKGWKNFSERSILLSSLVEGTLIIEAHMRLAMPTKPVPSPFIPENPLACKTIQGLFMNDDIVFEVGGDQIKDNAVAKTSLVLYQPAA
jgi:hypothetical protein